jgi:hypothetical protein
MSYDYGDDDVVVNREGGYYGGGLAMPGFISNTAHAIGRPVNKMIYGSLYDSDFSPQNCKTGYIVMALMLVAVVLLLWFIGWLSMSGMSNSGHLPFHGVPSQPALMPFMNNRDAPYFPDVTNDVIRREDMEAEAVRALAKINQERIRRAPPSDSAPLEWGPFWDEWRQTHGGVDYAGNVSEGFVDVRTLGGIPP